MIKRFHVQHEKYVQSQEFSSCETGEAGTDLDMLHVEDVPEEQVAERQRKEHNQLPGQFKYCYFENCPVRNEEDNSCTY